MPAKRSKKPASKKSAKSAARAKKGGGGKAPAKAAKFVYSFGDGKADGHGKMKELLGGKGANLAEMTRIGLPVPPGFTITTEVCSHFYKHGHKYPKELDAQIRRPSRRWRGRWARPLGTPPIRCWWRSGRARGIRCPG